MFMCIPQIISVMATFKCAASTTEFLSAEQVAVIFADRRSVDILSEGSSCESADESFWESSAVDTAMKMKKLRMRRMFLVVLLQNFTQAVIAMAVIAMTVMVTKCLQRKSCEVMELMMKKVITMTVIVTKCLQ